MKILLIHPNGGFRPSQPFTPLGMLSIATYLKQRGHQVRVYDRDVEKTPLKKVIQAFQPDVVGVSAISKRSVNDGIDVSRKFRGDGIPVVWGGHMATIAPELVLEEGVADYVVLREGEVSFYELLRAIELGGDVSQVKGIVYKDETGSVCRTPEREFANLADFPATDWSLVDPRKYFSPNIRCEKLTFVYCSKGCPGNCAFCYNKGFHRCQYRKRPNEIVVSEIRELAAKYGMDGVEFADELFGANKKELCDLCDRLRDLRLVWGFQTRAGHLTREHYQYMYDAGCRWAFFGVESGSPDMLKRIHKDWINLETIDRDFQYCREIGISTYCAIIIGFPDETEDQLRDTVRLMLRLNADLYPVSMYYPNPGSEFYHELVERGRVSPMTTLRQKGNFFPTIGTHANYSNVPTRDLYVIQSFFNWRNFFHKDFTKDEVRYKFVRKSIVTSFNNMRKQGFFQMWYYVFSSARLFGATAWFRYAYPGVRKKYGLYRSRES